MTIWRTLRLSSVAIWVGMVLAVPVLLSPHHAPARAQADLAPCGIIDGFDWPMPDMGIDRTDFGIFRAQFGGLHTGMDVAFEQLGEPVRAAARGIVTYSDPAGWDTEKGVVVIQHTMPDGSLVNTLYGHMEELNGYTFPLMNDCVEQGEIVGAIGFPSRGRPHLHYEIRTRYRHEGGPGYTDTNPLELGWLHPADFTMLARIWVQPAYRAHFTLVERATLPLLVLGDGTYVIAHSGQLINLTAQGDPIWRFDTLGSVIGMVAFPDDRVLAMNSAGQMLVLQYGGFSALWELPEPAQTPPLLFGNLVVVGVSQGATLAFSADGTLQWQTPPLNARIVRWALSGEYLALATDADEFVVLDAGGAMVYRATFPNQPIPFAAPEGGFKVLSGGTVFGLDQAFNAVQLVSTELEFLPNAELLHAPDGLLVIYPGEGRSLYAYTPEGVLAWLAFMPGSHLDAPLLGVGGGTRIYALTFDGQMLAYDAHDGHLIQQVALYNGGVDGTASARWLVVDADDTVRFNSGFLTYLTLNGLELRPD